MRTTIAVGLAATLLAGPIALAGLPVAGAATAKPPGASADSRAGYRAAISHPKEDSNYPGKGDPRIDTLHYDLDLSWDVPSRTLTGTAAIRFRVARDTKRIRLDLGSPLKVIRVRYDGATVSSRHPGKNLIVRTGRLNRGDRHVLRISYAGTPRPVKAPTSRGDLTRVGWTTTGDGRVWTLQEPFGAFTWYPVNDHPSDKAFYDARISVPRPWVGVFNGKLVQRRSTANRTITRFHLGSPAASYLTTIAIGPYERIAVSGPHGLPIVGWVTPGDQEQRWLLREMPSLLRWLEAKLGRYPFDHLGVVYVPSDSAMETQTLVTMGTGRMGFSTRFGNRATMLHELAHQWYGDTVTPRDWGDLWLNEGFAMYVQLRWEAAHGGDSMSSWREFLLFYDQRLRNKYGPPGDYHRRHFASSNVYYCPALMLIELRRKLGAAEFDRLLRVWPQQHESSNQSRASYIRWLNRQTGRHLGSFVREWLLSPTTPN